MLALSSSLHWRWVNRIWRVARLGIGIILSGLLDIYGIYIYMAGIECETIELWNGSIFCHNIIHMLPNTNLISNSITRWTAYWKNILIVLLLHNECWPSRSYNYNPLGTTPYYHAERPLVTSSTHCTPFTNPFAGHYHTIYIFSFRTTPVHHRQKQILSVKENTWAHRQTLHRATIMYAFPVNPE